MNETSVDLIRTVKPLNGFKSNYICSFDSLVSHTGCMMNVNEPVSLFVLAIHSPGVAENQYVANDNQR